MTRCRMIQGFDYVYGKCMSIKTNKTQSHIYRRIDRMERGSAIQSMIWNSIDRKLFAWRFNKRAKLCVATISNWAWNLTIHCNNFSMPPKFGIQPQTNAPPSRFIEMWLFIFFLSLDRFHSIFLSLSFAPSFAETNCSICAPVYIWTQTHGHYFLHHKFRNAK